jgi:rhodanese-related sulfurtransferase
MKMFASLIWLFLKGIIRLRFPGVRQISTARLNEWLAEPAPPLLWDVRTPAEYAVSHLPSADLVSGDAIAAGAGLSPDTPIVVYCSVGYRSAAIAAQLQAAGFRQVFNLEGSIFEWANQHRPIYANGQIVQQVHPYNRHWGKLLK